MCLELWNVNTKGLRISAIMVLMRGPAVRPADGFQAISVSTSVFSEGVQEEENKTGVGCGGHTHAHSMFPEEDDLPLSSRCVLHALGPAGGLGAASVPIRGSFTSS